MSNTLLSLIAEWGDGNTSWVVSDGLALRSQTTHGATLSGDPCAPRQSQPRPVGMPPGGTEAMTDARAHIDAGAERVMFTRHGAEIPGNVGFGIGVDDNDPRMGWTVYPAGGRLAPHV